MWLCYRAALRRLLFCAALLLLLHTPALGQDVISIDEAREAPNGTAVTIEGVVTRAMGDFTRLQDESGALTIRQTGGAFAEAVEDGTIAPGTRLRLTGQTSTFNGLKQVNEDDLQSYTVRSQNNALPAPQLLTLEEIAQSGEAYESELVRVDGLTITASGGTFEAATSYTVTDGSGTTLTLRVPNPDDTAIDGEPLPRGTFVFEGVLGQFNGAGASADEPDNGYQLVPVQPDDVMTRGGEAVFRFGQAYALAYEPTDRTARIDVAAQNVSGTAQVTVSVAGGTADASMDLSSFSARTTLTFTSDGTQTLALDIADDDREEGVEWLGLSLSSSDGAVSTPSAFTLWILDDSIAQTRLYPDLEGQALVEQVREDFGDPPTLGLDRARDTLYAVIYNEGGQVCGRYAGCCASLSADPDPSTAVFQGGAGLSAEHVWPQSQGASEEPARSNLHNLFPVKNSVNQARSNYPFGDIPDGETDVWFFEDEERTTPPAQNRDAYSELNDEADSGGALPRAERRFEVRESSKGNAARAAFYFFAIYPDRAREVFYLRQKQTLRQWHEADPVDAEEARRNVLRASYQGNKLNPFVLDPTLPGRMADVFDEPAGEVLSIADARGEPEGSVVTIEGTVTRAMGDFVYLQDETAGLTIRQTEGAFAEAVGSGTIQPGTRLRLSGATSFFNGLQQFNEENLVSYEILSQDEAPAPQAVTLSEIAQSGEQYEGELVRVTGLSIEATGAFEAATSYAVTDSTASLTLRLPDAGDTELDGQPIPEESFTFTGVVGQFNDAGFGADAPDAGYQLLAISEADVSTGEPTPLPGELPEAFILRGNAPNPFSTRTTVYYDLPRRATRVTLSAYDALGRRVLSIVRSDVPAGAERTIEVEAAALAPGVYLYRLEAAMPTETLSETGQMVVVK